MSVNNAIPGQIGVFYDHDKKYYLLARLTNIEYERTVPSPIYTLRVYSINDDFDRLVSERFWLNKLDKRNIRWIDDPESETVTGNNFEFIGFTGEWPVVWPWLATAQLAFPKCMFSGVHHLACQKLQDSYTSIIRKRTTTI